MTDDSPLDLRVLDPGEPPEVVRGAIHRFRLRVVLATVMTIVLAVAAAGWAAAAVVHARDRARDRDLRNLLPPAERAIVEDTAGVAICRTPTFSVGGSEVTLLQAVRMTPGGWALHLVVSSDASLTTQREDSGGSFWRFTMVGPSDGASAPVQVAVPPGATTGEAYVAVPSALGDRIQMQLTTPERAGGPGTPAQFEIDLTALTDCS